MSDTSVRVLSLTALSAVIALSAAATHAAEPGKEYNLGKGRLALAGYDPVSYFDGAPAEGKAGISLDHGGAVYRFATEENKAKFAADPTKYKPAYGGWCATAMAEGDKVEIDPKNYKITGGRLFLFYNGFWGDAKKKWVKDESKLTRSADAAWKKIAGE
jgi:YHS domain-containing protein